MTSRKKSNLTQVESSGDESDDEIYKGNEVIQVDFEGRNPIASDFHGIRQLLQQLFLKADINLSELTNIIIDQDFIGSVVIQSEVDDDEDEDDNDDNINEFNDSGVVFGITSAVNISSKAPNGCLQQLRTFLIDKAEHSQSGRPIVNILKDEQKTIGLLLNERFVNIPPQIAVPMLESLQKEVQRAANKREGFRFDHYILIVKLYRKDGKNNKEEDIYSNGEEEVICEQALANFTYSVKGESDTALAGNWRESDSTLIPYRKVLLIDANQLDSIIHSIKQLIE